MCIQFRATVYRTTGPAAALGHDGKEYTNLNIPTGTLVAQDEAGNWYLYRGANGGGIDDFGSEYDRCWPKRLFRDYWRSVEAGTDSPYVQALVAAPKKQLN